MPLTVQSLMSIGGPGASPVICGGIVADLAWLDKFGISQPHRLCHFLAQCGEESDHFHTLTEYASGAAYEGRADLGNTQPGDGVRFKGRGMIETTGRFNARAFTAWIRKIIPTAPDFEADPTLLATFPWALYSAVWYWTSHNLNVLADANNIIAITHKVNGGLNGLGERIAMFVRAGLVLLGYQPSALRQFQQAAGITVDGLTGTETLNAIFAKLKALELKPAITIPSVAPPAQPVAPAAPAAIRPQVPGAAIAMPSSPSVTHLQVGVGGLVVGAGAAAVAASTGGISWLPIIVGAIVVVLVVGFMYARNHKSAPPK